MSQIFTAGDKNPKNRGDCFIKLKQSSTGQNEISIQSKVEKYFGDSIKELALDILNFYDIGDAHLTIQDRGALQYVLAARIEAAIRKAFDIKKGYLPEFNSDNNYTITKERKRRSRLYLPGNTAKFIINACVHHPDAVILDLEDSVPMDKKTDARILVRNALRVNDFLGAEKMVRINQLPAGLEDLEFVIPQGVHTIVIPKCQSVEDIKSVEESISGIDGDHKNENIFLLPIIEDPQGLMKAYDIARSSDKVAAMAIGLEDYTASLGVKRTKHGDETKFARNYLVNAARGGDAQPLDSVFSDVADQEGLREFINTSKMMGFAGMGCIHPRQIKIIHDELAPAEGEIEDAQRVAMAFEDAVKKGQTAISLDNKMIDPPVVKRAYRVLEIAIDNHQLEENWRENYEN